MSYLDPKKKVILFNCVLQLKLFVRSKLKITTTKSFDFAGIAWSPLTNTLRQNKWNVFLLTYAKNNIYTDPLTLIPSISYTIFFSLHAFTLPSNE